MWIKFMNIIRQKKIKDLALKIKEEKYDLLIDFSEMLRVNQ